MPTGNRPIHVVHVMPQIGIGGAETQLFALITRSDPALVTHEVLHYSPRRDDAGYRLYESGNVKFTAVARNRLRPVAFLSGLSRAIRECAPDIVHCWLISGVFWGRVAAMCAGVKRIIVAYRNTDVARSTILRWTERITASRCIRMTNSGAAARIVGERLGFPAARCRVIYNGIDTDVYKPVQDREALRRELGLAIDERLIVTVGRMVAQKNHRMFLAVAQQFRGSRIRFAVVGQGPLEAELRQAAQSLGVTDTVSFLGLRCDVPRVLAAADLFLFPSLFEGFPNALLEAMSAGLPVVTSAFDGVDELITDGVTGRIFPLGDEAAAHSAVQELLNAPAEASRLGHAARQAAIHRFSMKRMVDDTVLLYQSLMCDTEVSRR